MSSEKQESFYLHETLHGIGSRIMLVDSLVDGRVTEITILGKGLVRYAVTWRDGTSGLYYEQELMEYDGSLAYTKNTEED